MAVRYAPVNPTLARAWAARRGFGAPYERVRWTVHWIPEPRPRSFLIKVGQKNARFVPWRQLPEEAQSACTEETFEKRAR
jgi:hypothetical protein